MTGRQNAEMRPLTRAMLVMREEGLKPYTDSWQVSPASISVQPAEMEAMEMSAVERNMLDMTMPPRAKVHCRHYSISSRGQEKRCVSETNVSETNSIGGG
mmetsp:Transcript_46906/g.142095  ORF Transcript_46906/g.142095 Transcript_46906/m.142095 type:complete len:100 (-) Transcript_46906:41-340(-)